MCVCVMAVQAAPQQQQQPQQQQEEEGEQLGPQPVSKLEVRCIPKDQCVCVVCYV